MKIQEHIPLKDKNWFCTGGPARYFCEPSNAQEFQEALKFAQEKKIEIFVLGHGANIVVSDNGFDGLVIRPQKTSVEIDITSETQGLVTVGAGVLMDELIQYTLDHNLVGLEIFSNIPGTIGGSVYINLHYFEAFLSHFVVGAQVIDKTTGDILSVDHDWFEFGYDKSKLMNQNYYLVNATLQLKKVSDVDAAFAKGRRFEIVRHRASRYPKSHTCGSFFRNFHDDEVTLMWEGKKMIYIAYYLDKIGVKGCEKVGDVHVSSQHANMLVNDGNGTSADIIALAQTLQKKIKEQFCITPQAECIFVGFKEHPLLTPT
jgi:UDP-N-acetylmuramate dehydrogenase